MGGSDSGRVPASKLSVGQYKLFGNVGSRENQPVKKHIRGNAPQSVDPLASTAPEEL